MDVLEGEEAARLNHGRLPSNVNVIMVNVNVIMVNVNVIMVNVNVIMVNVNVKVNKYTAMAEIIRPLCILVKIYLNIQ